ncbi:MAG: hypothetical protein SGJ10_01800 [Bacteroidota bacterium]|nr:hypothetical protein [Bacteroidota bacterium]
MRAFTLILVLFILGSFVSPETNPQTSIKDDEDFCTVFFRIIKAGVEQNFDNIKGKSLGTVRKGNNFIQKWESIENLPGQSNAQITKSFATSFTSTILEADQITDSMKTIYEKWGFEIKDCLSPSWLIRESAVEGLYKKISIGRRDPTEMLKFPNIILEIENLNGKYVLYFKVIK